MADLGPKAKIALAEVRTRFVDGLDERVGEIERAAAAVLRCGSPGDVGRTLEELQGLAHKLAGTAGMFGFHALSDASRVIEQLCLDTGLAAGAPTPDDLKPIETAMETLERIAKEIKREYAEDAE